MGSKGKTKYDYGSNGKDHLYGIDAPCFLETPEFKSLQIKITGLVYQFSGEITAGQIVRYICGDMEKGRERQRFEGYVSDAIASLESARVIESVGIQWVKYRKAEPTARQQEAVIDNNKQNEYKAYMREIGASYATGW